MSAFQERVGYFARWIVLAIAVVVPLANAVPQSSGVPSGAVTNYFDVPKLVALSLLLVSATALWVVSFVVGRAPLRHAGFPQWVILAFAAVGLLSAVFGVHVPTAFFGDSFQYQGAIVWVGYLLLWFLLVQTVTTRSHAVAAAWTVVVAGALVAAYDLVQILWMDISTWGIDKWMANRGVSTLGNPSHLGGYLVVPLVLSVSLVFASERRGTKAFAAVSAAMCFGAIVLTLTRAAWLAAFVGIVLLVVLVARASGRLRLMTLGLAAALSATGLGLAWIARPQFVEGVVRRLQGGAGDSGRSIIWSEAVRIISKHPLLGVGPDSYRLAWYSERSPDLMRQAGMGIIVTEPHNLLLTIAATFGLMGLGAFVLLVGAVLWRSRSAILQGAGDPKTLPLAAWWVATVALLVFLMFSPSPIAISTMLIFCLGILGAAGGRRVAAVPSLRLVLAVATALAAVIVATVGVRTFATDAAMTKALVGGDSGVIAARSAVRIAPWSTPARLRLAGVYAQRVAQGGASGVDQGIAAYEQAVAFSPNDVSAYWEYVYFLVSAASQGGASPQSVVDVADRALAVDPYAVAIAMNEVVALQAIGRDDDVVALLDDLWDLDPEYHEPGVAYARALASTGDAQGAARVAQNLSRRFPEEPAVSALSSEIASLTAGSR